MSPNGEGPDRDRRNLLPSSADPSSPEVDTRHAGKVFVVPQTVLEAAGVVASDGTDPAVLKDRLLLCLWDVNDGTSLWIAVQTAGDYEIPHGAKVLASGDDPNWMNSSYRSRYRDGTVWRLGRPGRPFKYRQRQQRAVTLAELERIRARISSPSVARLIAQGTPET